MGLYSQLPDDIQTVDIIIAGGQFHRLVPSQKVCPMSSDELMLSSAL